MTSHFRRAELPARTRMATALASLLIALVTISGRDTLAASPPCVTTTTSSYSVQVCLTRPDPGSVVSGNVGVSASATLLSGSSRVTRFVYTIDGVYTLTDYQRPSNFFLPTAHWVDGAHNLSLSALMSDGTNTGSVTETITFSNGVTVVPPNTNAPTITSGTMPAPGANFVVAAVGDGASGDPSNNSIVSTINSWSPNLFLYLGDVYEKGSYAEFANWYEGSFGVLRPITDPVVGNHEYGVRNAAGYFDYWNNEPNYYSFDAGGWHFIALNSTSQFQSVNWSGELSWLQNDLAAHAGGCIIAFWHHPLFNIGPEGSTTRVQDFWTPLANARATLVLNGHDHDYQRWEPLDANGNPSATGLTEIIAGTGGHSHQSITGSDPRVVTSLGGVFGALQLQVSPTAAQFKFFTVSGSTSTQFDAGTIPCRGYGSLAGKVTDNSTGNPLSGATVSYSGASTTTDSSGSYSLPTAPVGNYALKASAAGYVSQSVIVKVGPGQAVTQSFALVPATSGTGSINGSVTDAVTGSPLTNASITYSGGSTTTDANGKYSLSGVPAGSNSVTASDTAYTSQGKTVTVTTGATTTQDFALSPLSGSVSGRVTDAATSQPLAGATVSYPGGSTLSDGSGMYSFPSVTEGTYTFSANFAGHSAQSKTATVGAAAMVTLNFSLGTSLVFADGFESGSLSAWTANAGLVVQSTTVHQGSYAAEANSTGGAAYARRNLGTTYTGLYARTYFFVRSLPTSTANLIGDRTAASSSLCRVYIDSQGRLGLRNDVAGISTIGPQLSVGSWHSVELHVVVNGTSSTIEVWLDGVAVSALTTQTANLGSVQVGQIQLGENQTGRSFDIAFDDVVVQTARIGP
jgi:Carboxypeptidase regulatory-like domain/Calcineurin-like phosphoesterase